MRARRGVAALLLSAALAVSGAAQAGDDARWTGHWTGTATDTGAHSRIELPVDLTLADGPDGLTLRDADRMRGNAEPVQVAVDGDSFSARYTGLWPTPITVTGTLSDDGKTLSISMSGDGMTGLETHAAVLRRDAPAAARWFAPRIGAGGKRIGEYRYRQPMPHADGIAVASPEDVGLDRAPLEAMVNAILAQSGAHDHAQTESVLVMRHGRLVLEEYFWGQSAANPHMVSSVTKSVSSILVGTAYDAGRLDPDRQVASYFPDRTDAAWVTGNAPVTVRQMLAMSSGGDFDLTPGGPNSGDLLTTDDVVGLALGVPLVKPAGSSFHYDNSLPSLAGPLAARLMGQPLVDLAQDRLFAPLGIRNYRWTMLPEGTPLAAGGLYLRPRDMLKIGQMMLDGGTWNGHRIVSRRWIDESVRKQTAPGEYAYGFYWHLNDPADPHIAGWHGYMALGQGGQIIAVDPERDMTVVITSANWAKLADGQEAMEPEKLIERFVVPAMDRASASQAANGRVASKP